MELDARHYARVILSDDELDVWRTHACLPRSGTAQRNALYAAAAPLLLAASHVLVNNHSWRPASTSPDDLFVVHHPASDALFALPRSLTALFTHAVPCARMFDALLTVHLDENDGRLCVDPPLTDIFHLLQLLTPGCFTLVKAEYATHEVDDDGEVGWISWHTFTRALPPPAWMDFHSQQLIPVFGRARWAALRRAAQDSEVLTGGDITFS